MPPAPPKPAGFKIPSPYENRPQMLRRISNARNYWCACCGKRIPKTVGHYLDYANRTCTRATRRVCQPCTPPYVHEWDQKHPENPAKPPNPFPPEKALPGGPTGKPSAPGTPGQQPPAKPAQAQQGPPPPKPGDSPEWSSWLKAKWNQEHAKGKQPARWGKWRANWRPGHFVLPNGTTIPEAEANPGIEATKAAGDPAQPKTYTADDHTPGWDPEKIPVGAGYLPPVFDPIKLTTNRQEWLPLVENEAHCLIMTWDSARHIHRTASARGIAVLESNIATADRRSQPARLARILATLNDPPEPKVIAVERAAEDLAQRIGPVTRRLVPVHADEGEEVNVDRWLEREPLHWTQWRHEDTADRMLTRVAINISRQTGSDEPWRAAAALAIQGALTSAGRLCEIDLVDIGADYLKDRHLTEVVVVRLKSADRSLSTGEAVATLASTDFFVGCAMAGFCRALPCFDNQTTNGYGSASDIPTAIRHRWDIVIDACDLLSAEGAARAVRRIIEHTKPAEQPVTV